MEFFEWLLNARGAALLLNWSIVFCLAAFFSALSGSFRLGAGTATVVLVLMAAAHDIKLKWMNQPLYPWELALISEVVDIWAAIWKEVLGIKYLVIFFLTGLVLAMTRRLFPPWNHRLPFRLLVMALAVLMLTAVCFYRWSSFSRVLSALDISNKRWAQLSNYKINGLPLAFCLNVQGSYVPAPPNYDQEHLGAIVREYGGGPGSLFRITSPPVSPPPDVIVVLSESFWDATRMSGVKIEPDPLPFFHNLQKASLSGNMLSPTFGGTTCNVEFELLTGLSMSFLPDGAMPFQQHISQSMPSLASVFKSAGYRTTAIQPLAKDFFNSEKVYQRLGFDHYFSREDFVDPEYKGVFISDREVIEKVIERLAGSPGPDFIYALTVQNHGAYKRGRYSKIEAKVSGNLPPKSVEALETYSQGLKDADEALTRLVTYLKKRGKPSVLLFFGDHLPYFGDPLAVYSEGGAVAPTSTNFRTMPLHDYLKMRSPPFLIWTQPAAPASRAGTVSAAYIGHFLLKAAGIETPFFSRFLGRMYEVLPGLEKYILVDSKGEPRLNSPDGLPNLADDYRLLEYDLMFGKRYALEPGR